MLKMYEYYTKINGSLLTYLNRKLLKKYKEKKSSPNHIKIFIYTLYCTRIYICTNLNVSGHIQYNTHQSSAIKSVKPMGMHKWHELKKLPALPIRIENH